MAVNTTEEKYKSVSQFATLQSVPRLTIYRLIDMGKIVPVDIAGRKCIDMDVYGDMDVKTALKEKEADLKVILKNQIEIKNRIKKIENIVFSNKTGK